MRFSSFIVLTLNQSTPTHPPLSLQSLVSRPHRSRNTSISSEPLLAALPRISFLRKADLLASFNGVRSVRFQCFGIVSSLPEHASPLPPLKSDLRSEPRSLSRPSTSAGSPIRLYEEYNLLQNCLVCDPTVNQLSMFRFSTNICVDSAWQRCRRHQCAYLEQ